MWAFPSPGPRHSSAAVSSAPPAALCAVPARQGFSWG